MGNCIECGQPAIAKTSQGRICPDCWAEGYGEETAPMTDTQTPERIWVVYAEGSESRDELPEVFAALEEWELEKLAKCYESPAVPFIPFKLHAAVVAERDQLKAKLTELEKHNG